MDKFRFIRGKKWGQAWPYLAVFGITGAIVGVTQWTAGFADPDSFYHMKMTLLMIESGRPVVEFPWLPLTVLAENYADHHFLYHLLLIPFFLMAGPVAGIKIATALLAAAAMTAFFGLLRSFGLNRYPLLFTLLLTTSGGFLIRLSLAKTPAVALLWFFLELIAIRQNRPLMLFLLAFTHVWLHGSWPLLPVALAAYLASDWLVRADGQNSLRKLWACFRTACAERARLLWMAGSGLLLGLLINPFFPGSLRFYWEQIVQISIINYQTILPVGTEWLPFSALDIADQLPMLVAAVVFPAAALGLLLDQRHRFKSVSRSEAVALVFIGLLCLLFTLMTMRQRRQAEYLAPSLTMLGAGLTYLLLKCLPPTELLAQIRKQAGQYFGSPKLLLALGLIAWSSTSSWAIIETRAHNYSNPIGRYEATAEWMRQNLPAGTLVTNVRWDDFPALFYHDSDRYWFSGLDPTFSYRADPETWNQVQRIWRNEQTANPAATITAFGSRYLLLSRQDGLSSQLSHDKDLELAYHDNEAILFKVKQP